MAKMTKRKNINLLAVILFALIAVLTTSIANAGIKSDAFFWPALNMTGPIFDSQKFVYGLYIQDRTNLSQHQDELVRFEPMLGYKIIPQLTVWAGYNYVLNTRAGAPNGKRYLQQLVWEVTPKECPIIFHLRARLEESTLVGSSEYVYTLRARPIVIFSKGFGPYLSPILYDEVFYNCNKPSWLAQRGFEQNRAFIGVRIAVAKKVSVDVGYINQYIWNPVIDRDNHIASLTLNVNT